MLMGASWVLTHGCCELRKFAVVPRKVAVEIWVSLGLSLNTLSQADRYRNELGEEAIACFNKFSFNENKGWNGCTEFRRVGKRNNLSYYHRRLGTIAGCCLPNSTAASNGNSTAQYDTKLFLHCDPFNPTPRIADLHALKRRQGLNNCRYAHTQTNAVN